MPKGKSKKTELQRLQETWYKKLKNEGFNDIEYADGSIAVGVPRSLGWKDADLRVSTQEYYYMAYHFLNEYKFECERDRIIWEYHSNGISSRNIAKLLKQARLRKKGRSRDRIWVKIKELEAIMKGLYLSA